MDARERRREGEAQCNIKGSLSMWIQTSELKLMGWGPCWEADSLDTAGIVHVPILVATVTYAFLIGFYL